MTTGKKRKKAIKRAAGRVRLRRTKQRLQRTKQRRRKSARSLCDPIPQSYGPLRRACAHFNRKLFGGALPPCLVTLQREKRAYGYFAGRRFKSTDGVHVTDEIALNPVHFAERGAKKVLSTLAHEQVHQWQEHCGKPSGAGYHNAEWAAKMRQVGLIPTDTGRRGGKQTGRRVTHYIVPGGAFDRAATALIAGGFVLAFVERNSKVADRVAQKKRESKTRYSCPQCHLNAWAKPNVHLVCGTCSAGLI
jgi:predicted SprT family Zn-dependent metalloprotease